MMTTDAVSACLHRHWEWISGRERWLRGIFSRRKTENEERVFFVDPRVFRVDLCLIMCVWMSSCSAAKVYENHQVLGGTWEVSMGKHKFERRKINWIVGSFQKQNWKKIETVVFSTFYLIFVGYNFLIDNFHPSTSPSKCKSIAFTNLKFVELIMDAITGFEVSSKTRPRPSNEPSKFIKNIKTFITRWKLIQNFPRIWGEKMRKQSKSP